MRDQYAGDVSDLLKFAFLRAVVPAQMKLGVAWYFIEGDDGRRDGRHTEYRTESKWSRFDSEIHEILSSMKDRSVIALEQLPFWPSHTRFHRIPVARRHGRPAWTDGMVEELTDQSVI